MNLLRNNTVKSARFFHHATSEFISLKPITKLSGSSKHCIGGPDLWCAQLSQLRAASRFITSSSPPRLQPVQSLPLQITKLKEIDAGASPALSSCHPPSLSLWRRDQKCMPPSTSVALPREATLRRRITLLLPAL